MPKILICYADAGYGHRKVAEAIAETFREKKREDVVVEMLDTLQKTPPSFKNSYPRLYFNMVRYVPWLWGWFFYFTDIPFVTFLIRPLRRLWNSINSKKFQQYVLEQKFDYILFTHFFAAEICAALKRKNKIRSTLITVVTDVIPHAVWQNKGTDIYWVMSEESRKALLKRDPGLQQVYTKGIPISSVFTKQTDKNEIRKKLGLVENLFTILFTSGSFGIGPTEKILNSLAQWKNKIQVMVVCGQNKILYNTLNEKRFPFPLVLMGFVHNMHELMSVSDLLFAKPGGATMCESLAKKLPMLIMSPIPGQESFNATWLTSHGAGFEINDANDIPKLMERFLDDKSFKENCQKSIETIAKPQAADDIVNFVLSCKN